MIEEELKQELLKIEEPSSIAVPMGDKTKTSNLEDDLRFIRTTSTIPTYFPRTSLEKIVVYVSGTTYRLYVWDNTNKTWRYVALT